MSKTKLAIVVFCIAFGLNGAAFLFSKKSFLVEETKNVWLYELPLTASPLDAYVSIDIGPHQGVIGTFFTPNSLAAEHPLVTLLADQWNWDSKQHLLSIQLKKNLTYSNGEPILPDHFVKAHEWAVKHSGGFLKIANWKAWSESRYSAQGDRVLIQLNSVSPEFDLESFLSQVLTSPLAGVIHPKNLESLEKGENPKKEWISSGPYKVRKWNPKEIELVSRDDFPVMMQKEFFRTLKFQSAPIKNPSCDFMEGRIGDERTLAEHTPLDTQGRVSVFWMCRSYQENAFCKDADSRKTFAGLISGSLKPAPDLLKGKKVRYRIPVGSDDFRAQIREKIENVVKASGGEVEETSYFFKSSAQTDIELEFVTTYASADIGSDDFATSLSLLSSRLGADASKMTDLTGLITSYPLTVLMKKMKGEPFSKVFLEPDLEEKKLSL